MTVMYRITGPFIWGVAHFWRIPDPNSWGKSMDYKVVLREIARKLAGIFDSDDDAWLVIIGGSVGDPYGYVTSRSDIDLLVLTRNPDHIAGEPTVHWGTGELKVRHVQSPNGVIETLGGVEGRWDANILFVATDKDRVRQDLEELRVDPKTHTPRLNKYLTYFVESEVYKDKTSKNCEWIRRHILRG